MSKSLHVSQILSSKWTYLVSGVLIALILSYCFECALFPLNRATDLPDYAAKTLGISAYTVNNRIDAYGATLYLLRLHDSTDNMVIAYPRSLLFSRYGQNVQFYMVPKDRVRVIFCQFEPGLFVRDLRLDPGSTTNFESLFYVTNTWTDPDIVEWSVEPSENRATGTVLSKQLFPYACIAYISIVISRRLYSTISKHKNLIEEP